MNSERMTVLRNVLEKASAAADQAEVFSLESSDIAVGFRNGVLREIHESQDLGCCLRILHNGRVAQVTTSNMDRALEMVDQAMELVPFGQSVSFSFPKPAPLPEVDTAPEPERDLDHMVDQSKQIIETLVNYEPAMMPNASSDLSRIKVTLMNSNGIETTYQRHTQALAAIAILAEEGNILSTYRYYLGQLGCDDPKALANDVIDLISMGRKSGQ
ncbi:MAG TPA: DNA gyrase modulator [bacterium]|nr:DNA gyrase modulator [bacterium]